MHYLSFLKKQQKMFSAANSKWRFMTSRKRLRAKTPQICTYHIVKPWERPGWSREQIVRPKTRCILNANTKYSPKIKLHFIENRKCFLIFLILKKI